MKGWKAWSAAAAAALLMVSGAPARGAGEPENDLLRMKAEAGETGAPVTVSGAKTTSGAEASPEGKKAAGAELTSGAEALPEANKASEAGTDPWAGIFLEEKGLELGESSLRYPAISGMEDAALQEKVNARILEDGDVTAYVTRMSQLISGGRLRVGWQGCLRGGVFSFAVSAEGAVKTPRSAFVWTGGNIDLADGREIAWEELFADPAGAEEIIEQYLEEMAPDMSAHLLNSQLLPRPESFRMTERGILLLYPADQLSTLGDRAGDVLIPWNRLEKVLNLEEGSVPERFGVKTFLTLGPESRASLETAAAAGALPGIPVSLGDSVREKTDEWHLLTDPDVYAGGRLFALEGGSFRNVFLMTDFLSESWDKSVVDGIRVDEGCVFGLKIGETTLKEWRAALGEPDFMVDFDGERAEAYRTVPGSRDYYEMGGHRLQLHCGEDGVLRGIILAE